MDSGEGDIMELRKVVGLWPQAQSPLGTSAWVVYEGIPGALGLVSADPGPAGLEQQILHLLQTPDETEAASAQSTWPRAHLPVVKGLTCVPRRHAEALPCTCECDFLERFCKYNIIKVKPRHTGSVVVQLLGRVRLPCNPVDCSTPSFCPSLFPRS